MSNKVAILFYAAVLWVITFSHACAGVVLATKPQAEGLWGAILFLLLVIWCGGAMVYSLLQIIYVETDA